MPKKQSSSLASRALWGSAGWILTVILFAMVGLLVSMGCYATIFAELWTTMPAFAGSRAGLFGAVLGLLLILSRPIGYVSAIYLVGFPAGFAAVGHGLGLRVALVRLAESWGQDLAAKCATLTWPGVVLLSKTPGTPSAERLLLVLSSTSEQKGASRRLVRFILARSKVKNMVASKQYLTQVREEPEVAQQRLHDAFARFIDRLGEVNRLRPLIALCLLVVLVTYLSRFWLGWLGVPAGV